MLSHHCCHFPGLWTESSSIMQPRARASPQFMHPFGISRHSFSEQEVLSHGNYLGLGFAKLLICSFYDYDFKLMLFLMAFCLSATSCYSQLGIALEVLFNRNLPKAPECHCAQMPSSRNSSTPPHCHPCTMLPRLGTKLSTALWTKKRNSFSSSEAT